MTALDGGDVRNPAGDDGAVHEEHRRQRPARASDHAPVGHGFAEGRFASAASRPHRGGPRECLKAARSHRREDRMDHQPLRGQKALVTGANSGIGEGVARALGAAGASVVVNYVSKPEIAEAIADQIRASGVEAMALRADVSKEVDVEAMFAAMLGAW